MAKQEPQPDMAVSCMLGNMHKMAAPIGLLSRYFIGPQRLNRSSDFNFVFTVIFREAFPFHTKFINFGRSFSLREV